MTLQKGNDVSAVAVFTHSLDTIQILDVKCTSYSFDIEAQQVCFQWEKNLQTSLGKFHCLKSNTACIPDLVQTWDATYMYVITSRYVRCCCHSNRNSNAHTSSCILYHHRYYNWQVAAPMIISVVVYLKTLPDVRTLKSVATVPIWGLAFPV